MDRQRINAGDLLRESLGDLVTASSIESDLKEFPISDNPGATCLIDIELNFPFVSFFLSSPACPGDRQRARGRERGRFRVDVPAVPDEILRPVIAGHIAADPSRFVLSKPVNARCLPVPSNEFYSAC